MEEKNKQRAQAGGDESTLEIDVEAEMSKIQVFLNFCQDFLGRQTRPSEIFHTPDNFGIKLTSGESFVISIPLDVSGGSMQPSHAQPVTGRRDYPEAMGGAVPVTGPPSAVPEGMEDRTISQGPVDRTQAEPMRRMDQ